MVLKLGRFANICAGGASYDCGKTAKIERVIGRALFDRTSQYIGIFAGHALYYMQDGVVEDLRLRCPRMIANAKCRQAKFALKQQFICNSVNLHMWLNSRM